MNEGPRATLSLSAGSAPRSVVLAYVDPAARQIRTALLELSPLSHTDRGLFWGEDPDWSGDPDIESVRDCIADLVGAEENFTLMLVPPRYFPDHGSLFADSPFSEANAPPFAEANAPPCGIYPGGSPLLKVLYVLMRTGDAIAMATVMDSADIESDIAIRRVNDPSLADRLPIFQRSTVVDSCVELLTGQEATPRRRGAMAAAIGSWPSAHAYWSSFGSVFSIPDLTYTMRTGQSRTMVGTASELFTVRWNVRRIPEIIDDVDLEYTLGMQKFGRLGKPDVFKFALVSTAKELQFTITCHSSRCDAVRTRYSEVWPPREPFQWLLPAVSALDL
jgi:hypothetical protein